MTVHAYYLLADPEPWDENYDLAETSLDLELETKLDVVDYMFLDNEDQLSPYIGY
jgi:hypothetical protein